MKLSMMSALIVGACVLAVGCDKKSEPTGTGPAKSGAPAAASSAATKAAEPKASAAPAAAALAAPDFTVTAKDLYAEFRPQIEKGTADAVRAKYTGKTVRISGEVKDNADMMGTWELSLKANEETGKAFLHPSKAGAEKVKALKPGEKVTLQCVSEGWEIGPQFKDCVVVP